KHSSPPPSLHHCTTSIHLQNTVLLRASNQPNTNPNPIPKHPTHPVTMDNFTAQVTTMVNTLADSKEKKKNLEIVIIVLWVLQLILFITCVTAMAILIRNNFLDSRPGGHYQDEEDGYDEDEEDSDHDDDDGHCGHDHGNDGDHGGHGDQEQGFVCVVLDPGNLRPNCVTRLYRPDL
ncbi:hypothetical protein GGR51DRAFT_572039, partial [Nemania sp. FL0031]